MEVSKLFISGLLCGTLALSPAKVDALVKEAVYTTLAVGGAYGAAKLGAELSGDENAKSAVRKLEYSGKSLASNAWDFFKSLVETAASVPGAIYNGAKKAFNGKGADENLGAAGAAGAPVSYLENNQGNGQSPVNSFEIIYEGESGSVSSDLTNNNKVNKNLGIIEPDGEAITQG